MKVGNINTATTLKKRLDMLIETQNTIVRLGQAHLGISCGGYAEYQPYVQNPRHLDFPHLNAEEVAEFQRELTDLMNKYITIEKERIISIITAID